VAGIAALSAAAYDAWYDTARGCWIGHTEWRLLRRMLEPEPGECLLDVGCGTGWFTRRAAQLPGVRVCGLDTDRAWLAYARVHDSKAHYLLADGHALPFADKSFDRVFSVTALCFIANWPQALAEMARVARKRIAVGLLNRASLLYRDKGRGGGNGAYRDAHWHRARELQAALAALSVTNIRIRSAIFLPSASRFAIFAERLMSNRLSWGGFLLVTADVRRA